MTNSLLFGIVKKDNGWIDEWVRYHLAIGFDHILIYDNNDGLDDYPMTNYVIEQCTLGNITIENKRNILLNKFNEFNKINNDYEFTLMLDINEFLSFNNNETNLNMFLNKQNTSLLIDIFPLNIINDEEILDIEKYKCYWPKLFKKKNCEKHKKTDNLIIKKIYFVNNETT